MLRTLFDSDHEHFRLAVRGFVDRHIMPNQQQFEAAGRFSRAVWLEAGRQDLLGLCVPAEYGGTGNKDFRFNAVLDEELTRAGLAYAAGIGVHVHVVAPYLVERTTEEQRQRWLPRFCSGELVTAIAMTEPSGGSDFAGLQARAARDGVDWVINGSKIFITNGGTADLVITAAKTGTGDGAAGISLFAVESSAQGFAAGTALRKVGQHQGDTAELFFDNVRVPAANVIGEVDRGFYYVMQHLAQERLASAVCNISHAQNILTMTMQYVRSRRAFGKPIGSLQHIRFLLANLVTEVDVCQAFVDACITAHCRGQLSAVDAAKVKLKSSEVQNTVADECLQLFGGYGYMQETPVAQAWLDARVTRIWAGTNEIMREVIGRSLSLTEPVSNPRTGRAGSTDTTPAGG